MVSNVPRQFLETTRYNGDSHHYLNLSLITYIMWTVDSTLEHILLRNVTSSLLETELHKSDNKLFHLHRVILNMINYDVKYSKKLHTKLSKEGLFRQLSPNESQKDQISGSFTFFLRARV